MKKVIICITLVILIVTACSPAPQATEEPIIDEQPPPTDIPMDLNSRATCCDHGPF